MLSYQSTTPNEPKKKENPIKLDEKKSYFKYLLEMAGLVSRLLIPRVRLPKYKQTKRERTILFVTESGAIFPECEIYGASYGHGHCFAINDTYICICFLDCLQSTSLKGSNFVYETTVETLLILLPNGERI